MKTPPVIIADYYRKHALLPNQTIECMEYTLKAIYNELSKFVLYLAFFALFGFTKVYLITYCVFVTLRMLTGGIHCKTYWGCFISSLFMISATIAVAHIIQNILILEILALISIVFPLIFAPVTPSFRVIKNPKKIWILKILSTVLALIWIGFAHYCQNDTIIKNLIFLSVAITNYQLIIPKWIAKQKIKEVKK